MAYSFKDHDRLVGEDVEIVTALGLNIAGEIVAQNGDGYYVRVDKESNQEYFIPKAVVVLVEARSRKIGGSA